jgi:hypothetical protein
MKLQAPLVGNAQERVQKAAISHVYFGRLNLPLADVLEPRRLPGGYRLAVRSCLDGTP